MNFLSDFNTTAKIGSRGDYAVIAILKIKNDVAALPSVDIRIRGKDSRSMAMGILSNKPDPYILMTVEQTVANPGIQVWVDNRLSQPNNYHIRAELYLQNLASNDQLVIEHLNLSAGTTTTDVIDSIRVGIEKPDGSVSELTSSPFDPKDKAKVTINLS